MPSTNLVQAQSQLLEQTTRHSVMLERLRAGEVKKFEKYLRQSSENASLYEQHYEAAGFVRVDRPQRGDMIVMQVGRTAHPNHAGIYRGTDLSLSGEDSGVLGPGPFLLTPWRISNDTPAEYRSCVVRIIW